MAIRIAIVNCASKDQESLTVDGLNYTASELMVNKIASYSSEHNAGLTSRIYRPPLDSEDFPVGSDYDAVIIPGSKHDIDEEGRKNNPWMETLIKFIRQTHSSAIPMLGICFGHQAIGVSFGSKMSRISPPENLELGFFPVSLTDEGTNDLLFRGIPKRFDAMQYHFRYIEPEPEGSTVLAWGVNPKIIQAFRIGKTTWGVQFHPDYSVDNIRQMIGRRKEVLSKVTDLSKVRLENSKRTDLLVLQNFLKYLVKNSNK